MDGAADLGPASAARHVVRLPDGTLFNRYWDDRAAPRDESYRKDVETARRAEEVYRDLRAGAESGWDFSSRWLADGKTLSTIRTTDIAPVDLNAVMVHLERTLAKAYRLKGDMEAARRRQADADRRSEAIRRVLWNGEGGFFADYLWGEGSLSETLTAATVVAARRCPQFSAGRRSATSARSSANCLSSACASAISGISGVGVKPSSVGASTAWASTGRPVDW